MSTAALATLLRIAVTAAIVLMAFAGFLQAYPAGPAGRVLVDYLDLAYKSVQLSVGQFPADLRGARVPPLLQVSRFLLPLVTAWVTLSLGWVQVRNRVRSALIRRRGDHLVVYGEGVLADGLIAGERARRRPVLAWVDEVGRTAHKAEALRAAHVTGSGEGLDLRALGLGGARAVVAAAPTDTANLEVARRAMDWALARRPHGDPLQVIARVDDAALRGALEQRLTEREQRDRVDLRLVSAPQLIARQFLLANPLDRLRSAPGEPVRLCWVGWSPIAEAMLVRVLASAHFHSGAAPELTVLDVQAARVEAAFRAHYPQARAIAPIRFEPLPDDAPSLVAERLAALATSGPFNAVYVTLPDAARGLSVALAAEAALSRGEAIGPPIHAHAPDAASTAGAGLVSASAVSTFGALASLADPETLLQERHDELARSIHEFYLEGRLSEGAALGDKPTLAEWHELPESVRDENRLVADCYRFKLRDIGASVVQGRGESLRFTPAEVESLAQAEHERWMATKRLDGWVRGEVRDDAARRHTDIRPYAELTEAVRDLDREQIRVLPRILAAAGERAVRDLTVALRPPSGVGAVGEAVRAALAGLAEAYPDRRPVVLGDLSDPGARAVLVAARGQGAAVAAVLAQGTPDLLAGLPAAEREAVADLVRTAERLHPAPGADAARRRALVESLADLTLPLDGAAAPRRPAVASPAVAPAS